VRAVRTSAWLLSVCAGGLWPGCFYRCLCLTRFFCGLPGSPSQQFS